jgi:hypothetical protein
MLTDEKTLELAKVFGAPFIVQSKMIPKSLREAFHKLGKTALLFEGGKSMLYDEEAIEYGVQGTKKVINFLKMKKRRITPKKKSVIIKKSKWLRASHSGMFHVRIKNGEWIKKRTLLGIITDPFGEFEKKIYAPFDCYIFCVNISPIVNRGDALFHVSLKVESEEVV